MAEGRERKGEARGGTGTKFQKKKCSSLYDAYRFKGRYILYLYYTYSKVKL